VSVGTRSDAGTGLEPLETAAVLSGRGLSKVYSIGETQIHALRSVDIDFGLGELVVVLGPSGSGKSTLLNIIGGLDVPSLGTLRLLGKDLTAATESELTEFRRQHIGFVFQFYNLIPSLTARENVALVTDIASDPLDADAALSLVGLEERRHHFPSQMSGGEQQRVAIARAVAKRPALLLCDEPTGALDAETGKRVLEVLVSVNETLGSTTILITHNAVIADLADRVLRMQSGMVKEVRTNERRRAPAEIEW
jgi:putative ABC transport system ATP-binding protein